MRKLLILSAFVVACLAAPTTNDDVQKGLVLTRPSPINPEVISDPKPPETIELTDEEKAADKKLELSTQLRKGESTPETLKHLDHHAHHSDEHQHSSTETANEDKNPSEEEHKNVASRSKRDHHEGHQNGANEQQSASVCPVHHTHSVAEDHHADSHVPTQSRSRRNADASEQSAQEHSHNHDHTHDHDHSSHEHDHEQQPQQLTRDRREEPKNVPQQSEPTKLTHVSLTRDGQQPLHQHSSPVHLPVSNKFNHESSAVATPNDKPQVEDLGSNVPPVQHPAIREKPAPVAELFSQSVNKAP